MGGITHTWVRPAVHTAAGWLWQAALWLTLPHWWGAKWSLSAASESMQAEVEQQLLPPAPGADCVPSVALGHLTPEFNANHDASFGAAHSHLRRKTL